MHITQINTLMNVSKVEFGTSGARGLVSAMTDEICYSYTQAFIKYIQARNQDSIKTIAIAGDLRDSTPRIMTSIFKAAKDLEIDVINCGFIPSPALALFGIIEKIPSIMVTGSHIPDDRNGIKFNTPSGEITKKDEEGIREQNITINPSLFNHEGEFIEQQKLPSIDLRAEKLYLERYLTFFAKDSLTGQKIGVYQHSGVARDIIPKLLESLGAEVILLGRSEHFIPVDTEAIRDEDTQLAKKWADEFNINAIVSTDGDADRPLISDEKGQWLRGDTIGPLCAKILNAKYIATPISCNSIVELSEYFKEVKRTKIGSPYVIEGMQLLADKGYKNIVGYEANGGFLNHDQIESEGKFLSPLPTRDALIVIIALLQRANKLNLKISDLLKELPQRYTFSNRIKNIPTKESKLLLQQIKQSFVNNISNESLNFLRSHLGEITHIDTTDGLKIHFKSNYIIHLRPSGNAPELRCYSEASTEKEAIKINNTVINHVASFFN